MSALRRLEAEDRAENRAVMAGTPDYAALRTRDAARRAAVAAILETGGALAAEDLYAAAWIFNHGDIADEARQAHDLARRAAEQGHKPARWLAAAALDRSLMYAGRPQRYGTNIVPDGTGWRVWDVDPATTDAERAKWDVPPLAEMHRRAAAIKGPQPPLDAAPRWLKDALLRWNAQK